MGFSKDDYFYLAELIITLIVSLLVLLFVVRPLVRRVITPEEITADAQLLTADSITQSGTSQIASNSSETLALENNSLSENTLQNGTVLALQEAKLSGEVHQAAIKEIGELIQNHPREATSVVQNWINETSVTA